MSRKLGVVSEERRWCLVPPDDTMDDLLVAGCGCVLLQFAVFHTCFGQLLV